MQVCPIENRGFVNKRGEIVNKEEKRIRNSAILCPQRDQRMFASGENEKPFRRLTASIFRFPESFNSSKKM